MIGATFECISFAYVLISSIFLCVMESRFYAKIYIHNEVNDLASASWASVGRAEGSIETAD